MATRSHSLSMLAMGDTFISFVDKSIVSSLHILDRKEPLSVAGTDGSHDVKTEIVTTAVSANGRPQPLTIMQFYVLEKMKMNDLVVDLQVLKDRNPHLRNLPKQSKNLISSYSWTGLV